jgi:hypothetical protein
MLLSVRKRFAPPGRYRTKLEEVRQIDGQFGKPALHWAFVVLDGEHSGSELTKTTSCTPRPGNKLGEFLAQLLDRPLREGEVLALDSVVGATFDIEATPFRDGDGVEISNVKPSISNA